jgi:hypothetical protein
MEIHRRRGSADVLPCRAAPGKPRLACSAVAAGRAAESRPRLACRAAVSRLAAGGIRRGRGGVGSRKRKQATGGLISKKAV